MFVLPFALVCPPALVLFQGKPEAPAPAKAPDGPGVEFALRPEKGKVYRFECASDSKPTSSMAGQSSRNGCTGEPD